MIKMWVGSKPPKGWTGEYYQGLNSWPLSLRWCLRFASPNEELFNMRQAANWQDFRIYGQPEKMEVIKDWFLEHKFKVTIDGDEGVKVV